MHPFIRHFENVWRQANDHSRNYQHVSRHSHRGFFGVGGRHGGPGEPGGGGIGGMHHGRKLGSADLQLLLLALLAEQPSHGYELIKALGQRSNGYYSPSPGMVYPALTYLEETGHASAEAQGAKRLYSITQAGLAHLEGQRAAADAMLQQLAWIGQRMEALRSAMQDADLDAQQGASVAGQGAHGDGFAELRAARHNLKAALIEKSGAPAAEQRRVAQILERAAAEIRGVAGAH
jgi:DNA-binding PadR family transcriptional regulator